VRAKEGEEMPKIQSSRFLSFLALFSLFTMLSFLFRDFLRENVVLPLYSLAFYLVLVLKGIPLWVYSALLATSVLLLGGNTLIRMRSRDVRERTANEDEDTRSRYDFWNDLLSEAAENEYAREKLFAEARSLLLLAFSRREGSRPYSKSELRALEADVPPEIGRLLEKTHGFSSRDSRNEGRWKRLLRFSEVRRENALALERDVEEILCGIEDILEVRRDGDTYE
jgi:hypothetical protein